MIPKEPIDYTPFWPETVIIWGAGASTRLGLPVTEEIGKIISRLAGIGLDDSLKQSSLDTRFKYAFDGKPIHPELEEAFKDLLLLLFDGDDSKDDDEALRRFRKHVKKLSGKYASKHHLTPNEQERLEWELAHLHTEYDWVGVRGIAQHIARRWEAKEKRRGAISLMDLLTTVDQLYNSDLAIPTEEIFHRGGKAKEPIYLMDKHRLLGVKRCLTHLTSTIQRILIQKTPGRMDRTKLKPYWDIANKLADLMKEEAEAFAGRGYPLNERRFYYYSYAFVSFNWDPVMLWLIFHAHKKINDARTQVKGRRLRLFNDSGDGIGIRKIFDDDDKGTESLLAFMMNESTCQRINDPKYHGSQSRLIRVGKLLFPHAGLAWRVCPRCGKLFTDMGDEMKDKYSSVAFGPDLLPELNEAWKNRPRTNAEVEFSKRGEFGGIQCIFCGSMTKPYDSPLILQSMIKSERHYVLEGIFRELGLVVGNARHLVFAGYSLPRDDYIYRCFFQAAWATKEQKYCTVINHDPSYRTKRSDGWLDCRDELVDYLESKEGKPSLQHIIRRMLEIFDPDHLRVSLLGVPHVVTAFPGKAPREALIDLLYPGKWFPEGFPPKRLGR